MLCETKRLSQIKSQVEFYFGDINYFKDKYMQDHADEERYIPIEVILKFPRMIQMQATTDDIIRVS